MINKIIIFIIYIIKLNCKNNKVQIVKISYSIILIIQKSNQNIYLIILYKLNYYIIFSFIDKIVNNE